MSDTKVTSTRGRLDGLDLARYVAFVGMVIVNFKIAMGAESDGGYPSRRMRFMHTVVCRAKRRWI